MADTPEFSNALASTLKEIDPSIACVMYSRHPKVRSINPELFIVNFTIESDNDPRMKYAPDTARIVGSAWRGKTIKAATINFMEHHVHSKMEVNSTEKICPVTLAGSFHTCDSAKCTRCFVAVR
jgi:hypothetical protein